MFKPSSFLLEHDETTGVVVLTLNRPERLNALTFDVYEELAKTFRALDAEPGVRAIVITGRRPAFCSGGDVQEIIAHLIGRDYQQLLQFTRMTCDVVRAMRSCRRPIIAAVNGTAAGGGAAIALAADIRIAAASARIAFLFPRVGLSGSDMGVAWLLPRVVGFGRASDLLMTGDFVPAEEACRIGLYNRVVPDGEALDRARELAEKLARGPSFALEVTKDSLNREAHMDLAAALEAEAQIQASLMTHADFREAYEAYRDKREPQFK